MSLTTARLRVWVVFTAALMLARTGWGAFAGTDVFLPMVGRGAGLYGTQWYTTVWVYNPNDTAVDVSFYLLERDQINTAAVPYTDVIQPGDTKCYENAVFTMFGKAAWGAMRVVTAEKKVVVNERFYSQAAGKSEKDSFGQDFAGTPKSFAIGVGESAQLLGVYGTLPAGSSELRYNFGFVEVTGASVKVRVTPRDETGAALAAPRYYTVYAFSQRQLAFGTEFPSISTDNARLTVEVSSGSGKVLTYGTGISNSAQAPTTFEMQYKDELLGAGSSGGLASVTHDSTLTGDGTAASPLGIPDGGVTLDSISTSGATSGQVPTYDGSSLAWQSPSGFTLPYDGSTTSASGPGFSITASVASVAIRGLATNTGTTNYGGYFEAYGSSGRGVAGAVNGASSVGVLGYAATGSAGYGVLGDAEDSSAIGVLGRNKTSGNYAELGTSAFGVHAVAASGTAVSAQSTSGIGLAAGSTTGTGISGSSTSGHGVIGASTSGDGVRGGSGGTTKSGVYGFNTVTTGFGVYGRNTATGHVGYLGGAYGVYGESASDSAYAGAFKGNVAVMSRSSGATIVEIGEGLDYAEGFDVTDAADIAPGTVLVIDSERPGRLAVSTRAYDRRVAGIIAGANGLGSGVRLGAETFPHNVALAGRVYCNVDASYGAVSPGDLLTTSPTPGHAMVVKEGSKAQGAVLGKAMEALAKGRRGQILVLVTLQ
jgi:hypothetical protein